jgi:hypothetical protein
MSEIDQDTCRKAAAECVELARVTSDPAKKEVLLLRAQEWLKLAYSHSEHEFDRHLSELNSSQMDAPRVQQQPMQQQQSKQES